MMENYFKPGSKSFKVIEMLNTGKNYGEVAKIMGYKHKNAISGIVSRWKTKDRLSEKETLKPEIKHSPKDEKTLPVNPLHSQFPAFLPRIESPQGPVGTVVQIEGFAPGKQIFLTAKNILMFQWFKNRYKKKWDGDISDFINETIDYFFKASNWQVKIVKEEIFT